MVKESMSQKGHLEGWQWRQSARAIQKKERAKARHFGVESGENLSPESNFVIEREGFNSDFGIVAETLHNNARVFAVTGQV